MKFKAEGQEFTKLLRSLEQFIQTVKVQNNFWYHNAFLTLSWRFLISNELEFKLEKILGFRKIQEKLEKHVSTKQIISTKHDFLFIYIEGPLVMLFLVIRKSAGIQIRRQQGS